MTITRLSLVPAPAPALGPTALSAAGEELGVATFVRPQHHANTSMFK